MNIKNTVMLALGVVMLSAGAAGCDLSSDDGSDVYTPAAYYQTVNGVADCYYVTTPVEVQDLVNAGLCPVHSVPTLMPVSWEEEYYSYYSSPAYYNTYVPASSRSVYVKYTVVSFKTKYAAQIKTASSKAVYKTSSGTKVSGSKVSTKSFGGGSRNSSNSGYGGGSRNYSGSKSNSYGSRK